MQFTFEVTTVHGAEEALRLPPAFHPEHLISIGTAWDPDLEGIENYDGNLLRLKFSDIKFQAAIPESFQAYGLRAPTREDVQEIIDFGNALRDGHLLVHCEMGISRSTAATLIVLATHTDPSHAEVIKAMVYAARPQARPNNLMLEYADELLGWGGALAALGGWGTYESLYGRTGSGR